MINFINISNQKPFKRFRELYLSASQHNQKNIEAALISSYDTQKKEVNSRFVNIKIIDKDNFIFFTNYNSTKATEFSSHDQISATFFWPKINIQIRIKAKIKKTSKSFNDKYFFSRSPEKNALAISSMQSKEIASFSRVKENYLMIKNKKDLLKCPEYWGGYSFLPYEIEFWEGHKFRLNKRDIYKKDKTSWNHSILEP